MTLPATCSHCHRAFAFDPADAPVQPALSRSRRGGAAVAYYPDCPHCGLRVEVTNPELEGPLAGADEAAGAGEPPAGGAGTVLVVEDDRDLAEGLGAVLRRHGYRVVLAGDGVQGRDAVERDRPDLVLLDMMMPRLGGLPVLEHFRGRADAPPFVMITANGGARHRAYVEALGAVGYLRKPFAAGDLVAAVARGLAGRSPRQGRHSRPGLTRPARAGRPTL